MNITTGCTVRLLDTDAELLTELFRSVAMPRPQVELIEGAEVKVYLTTGHVDYLRSLDPDSQDWAVVDETEAVTVMYAGGDAHLLTCS
jgi:hypothetical protein